MQVPITCSTNTRAGKALVAVMDAIPKPHAVRKGEEQQVRRKQSTTIVWTDCMATIACILHNR